MFSVLFSSTGLFAVIEKDSNFYFGHFDFNQFWSLPLRHCTTWNISNSYKELVTLDQLSTQNLVFYTMPNKMADVKISCLVCGSSAGKHNYYGARTCISCRGFFRRSVQSQQYSMFLCASDSSCDLESKSRKCCKRCRFEKCIKIGMRPSWVLTPEERCQRMLQR